MMEKAFSLETFPPPIWEYYAGQNHVLLRQYDRAFVMLDRVAERAPKMSPVHLQLACAYVELDRLDDAKDAIKAALELTPQYTIKHIAKIMPYRKDADGDRVFGALRKAGLPEG
jgi:tetratricopeptide (TPR) repeat protein